MERDVLYYKSVASLVQVCGAHNFQLVGLHSCTGHLVRGFNSINAMILFSFVVDTIQHVYAHCMPTEVRRASEHSEDGREGWLSSSKGRVILLSRELNSLAAGTVTEPVTVHYRVHALIADHFSGRELIFF